MWWVAMMAHPEFQKRAQDQLDKSLVVSHRPSQMLQNLPYIQALVKESLRWRRVPLASPMPQQRTIGMKACSSRRRLLIGIVAMSSRSGCLRDDAASFNPERFLDEQGSLFLVLRKNADVASHMPRSGLFWETACE